MKMSFAIGALLLTAMAPMASADTPCSEIATYLKDFLAKNSDLHDTGNAEFLKAAIDLFDEQQKVTNQPVEILDARRLDSGEDTGRRDHYDARQWGGFIAVSSEEGTLHCASAAVFRVDEHGIGPAQPLVNEGGTVCWNSSFQVIRVANRAYPAVVHNKSEGPLLGYGIDVMSVDQETLDPATPLCRVTVDYEPWHLIKSWLTDPGKDESSTRLLRTKLEPALIAAAAGQDAEALLKPIIDQEAIGSAQAARDRVFQQSPVIPFAEQAHTAYTTLAGKYLPIRVEGRRYLLGFGTATFGWREWPDLAFGVWARDGEMLVPVAGGFMGKEGALPRISVELP